MWLLVCIKVQNHSEIIAVPAEQAFGYPGRGAFLCHPTVIVSGAAGGLVCLFLGAVD